MSSDRLQELERTAARAQEAVNNNLLPAGVRLAAWMALQRFRKKIQAGRLAEMRQSLDALVCPACRGLGFASRTYPGTDSCGACCGSGWQNEETIRWLVNELRKRGGNDGGDDQLWRRDQ